MSFKKKYGIAVLKIVDLWSSYFVEFLVCWGMKMIENEDHDTDSNISLSLYMFCRYFNYHHNIDLTKTPYQFEVISTERVEVSLPFPFIQVSKWK